MKETKTVTLRPLLKSDLTGKRKQAGDEIQKVFVPFFSFLSFFFHDLLSEEA